MLKHIVMWKLKEFAEGKTKAENALIMKESLERLVGIVPEIISLQVGINEKEYILKNAVDYIRDDYDFIIIDCPPSLNMLTINAMTTADSVLVPIQCEYYALEGLSQLIHTIDLVQQRLNPHLAIDEAPSHGLPINLYDQRSAGTESYRALAKEVMERTDR